MGKFDKQNKYSKESSTPMVVRMMRFDQEKINEVSEIHNNFSEFVRDALDFYLLHLKQSNGVK